MSFFLAVKVNSFVGLGVLKCCYILADQGSREEIMLSYICCRSGQHSTQTACKHNLDRQRQTFNALLVLGTKARWQRVS